MAFAYKGIFSANCRGQRDNYMIITEVCLNVTVESPMRPLSGETFAHQSANVHDGFEDKGFLVSTAGCLF